MGRVGLAWILGLGLTTAALADEQTLTPQVRETKTQAEASAPAKAGEFANTTCTNGQARRLIELNPGDLSEKVPCEVHYKKETEQPGHDQVLWSAYNDSSFCSAKAQAFVDKLSGMGWNCAKM